MLNLLENTRARNNVRMKKKRTGCHILASRDLAIIRRTMDSTGSFSREIYKSNKKFKDVQSYKV